MARVLVVDDEEGIRAIVREILQSRGHEVVEATDGRAAFLQVREQAFDLVVCDIHMPQWDGLEAIKSSGLVRPATRFLILSAFIDDNVRQMFDHAGNVLGYLDKPFDTDEFVRIVEAFSDPTWLM